MSQARRRPSRNRRPGARTGDQHDLWQAVPALPDPAPITPPADPTALVGSLGPLPLPGHATTADVYVATVVERAAALATALAASADLLAETADD